MFTTSKILFSPYFSSIFIISFFSSIPSTEFSANKLHPAVIDANFNISSSAKSWYSAYKHPAQKGEGRWPSSDRRQRHRSQMR